MEVLDDDEESKGRFKLTGIVKRTDNRHAYISNDVTCYASFSVLLFFRGVQ